MCIRDSLRTGGGPQVRSHRGRGGRLAGEVPLGRGERASLQAERRGSPEGRADQEAETEGRGTHPGHGHLEGGPERAPFRPGDVRRVREVFPHASERRVCRLLSVPRSAMSGRRRAPQREPVVDHVLTERIEELIGNTLPSATAGSGPSWASAMASSSTARPCTCLLYTSDAADD